MNKFFILCAVLIMGINSQAGTVETGSGEGQTFKLSEVDTTAVYSAKVEVTGDVAPQGYLGDLNTEGNQEQFHVLQTSIPGFKWNSLNSGCKYEITYSKVDSFSINLISIKRTQDKCGTAKTGIR